MSKLEELQNRLEQLTDSSPVNESISPQLVFNILENIGSSFDRLLELGIIDSIDAPDQLEDTSSLEDEVEVTFFTPGEDQTERNKNIIVSGIQNIRKEGKQQVDNVEIRFGFGPSLNSDASNIEEIVDHDSAVVRGVVEDFIRQVEDELDVELLA